MAATTEAVEVDDTTLRSFGPITLTLAGIGTVVGAGIFVITGQAAALYAGPAVIHTVVAVTCSRNASRALGGNNQ